MKLLKISERSKTKYFERSTLSSESESVSRSVVSNSLRPMYYSLPGSSGHRILQARILPFPSPGDLPSPGIKPVSPALQADSLLSQPPVVESLRAFQRE